MKRALLLAFLTACGPVALLYGPLPVGSDCPSWCASVATRCGRDAGWSATCSRQCARARTELGYDPTDAGTACR